MLNNSICLLVIVGAISMGFNLASSYSSDQYPPPQQLKYYTASYEHQAPSWAKHSQYDNYDPKYEIPVSDYANSPVPLDYPQYQAPAEHESSQYYHEPVHVYMPSYEQPQYATVPLYSVPQQQYSGYSPYPQTKQGHHNYRKLKGASGHDGSNQVSEYQHQLEPSYEQGPTSASQYDTEGSAMVDPSQYGPMAEYGAELAAQPDIGPSEYISADKA